MKVTISDKKIKKRGKLQYKVEVRTGEKRERRFFDTKAQAEAFAEDMETQRRTSGDYWLALTSQQRNEAATILTEMNGRGLTIAQVWEAYRNGSVKAPLPPITLQDAIKGCVTEREALNCKERYTRNLRLFLTQFAEGRELQQASQITKPVLVEWFAARKNLSLETLKGEKIKLSALFSFCVREGYLAENPVEQIELRKDDEALPEILTVKESARLLWVTRRREPSLLIYIALGLLGIRQRSRDYGPGASRYPASTAHARCRPNAATPGWVEPGRIVRYRPRMNRLSQLPWLVAAICTFGAWQTFAADSTAKPNIIFILADDLGFADLSCQGHPTIKTPNIDRIASEGLRFTQAYASSPVCSPTRVSLMTGRYPQRLRVGLEEPLASNPTGLPPDHPTLPSLLRKAGYFTALIGKWHIGNPPDHGPLKSGYDYFLGFHGGEIDYFSRDSANLPALWENEGQINEPGYLTDVLGQRAARLIADRAKSKEPFFLSLHFNAPHWPWEGPDDQAEAERIHRPGGSGLQHFDGGSLKTYSRMVEAMDRQVGLVLKTLADAALATNTIVIFTSDNGGDRFSNMWPFTGKKLELLEGGLRVPALISWPSKIPTGKTSDQVSITMDWLPTLLAAAGAAPDPAYPSDGVNLLPVITGVAQPSPRTLFWRFKANSQAAIRSHNLKVLRIHDNGFLFDVVEDPMERANLLQRQPERFRQLGKLWLDWNATMLAYPQDSYSHTFTPSQLPDHYAPSSAIPKR